VIASSVTGCQYVSQRLTGLGNSQDSASQHVHESERAVAQVSFEEQEQFGPGTLDQNETFADKTARLAGDLEERGLAQLSGDQGTDTSESPRSHKLVESRLLTLNRGF
jgi:hypothetical protein